MQKRILAAVVASMMAGQAMAVTVFDNGTDKVTIGGHVGMRYVDQDNGDTAGDSSRINFGFEHKLTQDTTAFARAEWGFDVTKTNGEVFNNRLGYVGVKNDQFGSVTFGKAWSSYGKVAGWTDSFATTGGEASGYYGADGHVLGTARADDVLQYNHSIMGLNISAQVQLGEGDFAGNNRDSSYGIAASYELPMGLSIGAAYNQADVEAATDYKAKSAVVGVKFETDKIYAALTFADLENRTLFSETAAGVTRNVRAHDATGIELYASYQLNDMFKVEGGYNQLEGERNGVDLEQEVKYFPVAVVYTQGPVQLSGTYQFEKSTKVVDGETVDVDDKIILQARYYF
ncbi:porin [Endozoicomonas sp. GU-1]|uniref:porin n=1 Tax=Endozoicomonas sp. GU-1 TaxID=3009078 RepID=UPI0022B498E1|nr:porin [Endozoicomonas sp. GU-1]WBA80925.1 porin [Endozoicomonas sp. GU-1]WBA88492.1 porin [Endozoicomonas sp. GU-1]